MTVYSHADRHLQASKSREAVLPCFVCGLPAFHDHYVIPPGLGGTQTVPLCPGCLRKVNDRAFSHSALTRAGLAASRARGIRLGTPGNLTPEARRKGVEHARVAHRARARAADEFVAPLILALRARGMTYQDIVERLNFDGHMTRRGRPWNRIQVARVLRRNSSTPQNYTPSTPDQVTP